jgi:hypothetical protein
MRILALDLGIRTGWALASPGAIESGVQRFELKRGESPGMRYLAFGRWLSDIYRLSGEALTLIAYEQFHHRGGAATELAAGFATRVQEFCATWALEHAAVHSATLKKFATGKGNADKPAMIAAVIRRGWAAGQVRDGGPLDDNQADALALLHFVQAELLPAERPA